MCISMRRIQRSRNRSKQRRIRLPWALRQMLLWLWLTAVVAVVLVAAVPGEYDLAVNEVASQSIRAPRDVTFISEILTRQAREDAARRVTPLFTPPDPTIARQQFNRARDVLTFLRALRADPYGSELQRSAWIWAVPELAGLPEETVSAILTLPDGSWTRVQLEFLDLLDQVMRQEAIRETDLRQVRSRIPTLVPLDLAQDEAEVVEDLVIAFVRPNVFFDEEATRAAEEAAREAVGPVPRIFRSGQIVVREGAVVTELDIEALLELGLASAVQTERSRVAAVLFAVSLTLGLGMWLHRLDPRVLDSPRLELIGVLVLTLFLGLAWLLLRAGELVPFLYPGAAGAMLIATTISPIAGIGAALVLSAVTGWVGVESLALAMMVLLGSVYAVTRLPRYEQTGTLFQSGLLAGLVQTAVIFAFSVDELAVEPLGLLLKLAMAVLGGLISGALTIGGLFVLTPLFDLTTTFRLTELSHPNHPLLQRLMREAPATFNHVMVVTSLAEQAAERIGANALLTRVGAYYHDIGKLARPYFFVENQQGLSNPHERLDPYTSLDILAGHVRDGLELAKRYRLPKRVRDFIPEHHGTMRVSFLYQKAVEAAGGEADLVDESQFRYPGPTPQSRETLLVMLADGCEAATRARRPSTPEELEAIIDQIFQQRIKEGQLDACPITMAELHVVRQSYIGLLRGAYHPRVQYPTVEPKAMTLASPALPSPALAPGDEIATSEAAGDGAARPAVDGDSKDARPAEEVTTAN